MAYSSYLSLSMAISCSRSFHIFFASLVVEAVIYLTIKSNNNIRPNGTEYYDNRMSFEAEKIFSFKSMETAHRPLYSHSIKLAF